MLIKDIKDTDTSVLDAYHEAHTEGIIKESDMPVLVAIEDELQRRGVDGYEYS